MKQAVAFAPCHITGVFQIFDESADALRVGSRGAGISLSLGVQTVVRVEKSSSARLRVNVNNRAANSAEVSRRVVNMFLSRFELEGEFEIVVEHGVAAPLGSGFGTSGAAALSLALALNEALQLGMAKTEAAQVAHVAEVNCRTGLGTVIAETYGGLEIRLKPGAPGVGAVKRVPVPEDSQVACQAFGPISTRKCLTSPDTRARINELGGELVDELAQAPSAANFMKISRQFAEHVGLISEKVRSVLKAADDADTVCSMPMFGDSAFTITDGSDIERILKIFRKHGSAGQTIVSGVDDEGARVLR